MAFALKLKSLDLIKPTVQGSTAPHADEMPILGDLRLPVAADDRVRRCQEVFMGCERIC